MFFTWSHSSWFPFFVTLFQFGFSGSTSFICALPSIFLIKWSTCFFFPTWTPRFLPASLTSCIPFNYSATLQPYALCISCLSSGGHISCLSFPPIICRSNYSLRFLFFLPFRFLFPPALALIMQIQIYRSSIEDDDDCCTYTLTFNIEFPHDNDSVYFAHSYPYTYSDLQVIEKQIEIPLGFHFPSNHLTYCYVWIDGNNLRALHSIQQLIRLYSHKIGLFDGNTKASN